MKTTMILMTRGSITALGIALVCLAGTASAQNPRQYPALKSQQSDDQKKASASPADAGKKANLSAKDKRFINEAAKGGMMEVEWGKLAAQNGNHADVKKFGNRMVADHSKANDELTALARGKGVELPGAPSAGKWKSDKDYVDMMVKDHEKDLSEFQGEAKDGTDPDLKKFANKTSKVIEKHLSMIKEIQGKVK
jgi:putative membrane protein